MTATSGDSENTASDRVTADAGSAFEVAKFWAPRGSEHQHAMTCDVEDYFQVSAFNPLVAESEWDRYECRIPRNMDRALQLMSDAGVKGTFFTLGWVGERFPEVVRRIADEGHEVASHGMCHRRVWSQTPDEFLEDARRSKAVLEDAGGQPVQGYRAASWSLDARTPYAHTVLAEAGYRYSSSLFPIAHDHYGVPDAPRAPFYERRSGLLEIPATTVRLAGRNWPSAGGGYFRLLPLRASLWLLGRAASNRAAPALFYFHPWELDPGQPRIDGAPLKARFRHYLNLDRFESRFKVLLGALPWNRMDRIFIDGAADPAVCPSPVESGHELTSTPIAS